MFLIFYSARVVQLVRAPACHAGSCGFKSRLSRFFLILLSFTIISCGKPTLEDYREEGQSVLRSLVNDLRSVRTRQDLVVAVPALQKHFDRLAAIMIEAEQLRLEHGDMRDIHVGEPHISDDLRAELTRIYQLPDGRELIEQCQEGAFMKLECNLSNASLRSFK